mgnify:CR=1 FL=1
MSDLLTAEQLQQDLDFVHFNYDGEPDKAVVFDAACQRIRNHIEAQQQLLTIAVDSLKTLMFNNPTDEQIMAYLQEYAHLIETVPPVQESELVDDPSLWGVVKFDK